MHMAFLQTELCLLKTRGFFLISNVLQSRDVPFPFLRLCSQITTPLHFNTTRLILWSLSECHRKESFFLTFQPLSFSKKECIIPRVYLPRRLTDLFEYLHSFCSKSPSLFLLLFQVRGKKNPKYFSGIQMEQTILVPREWGGRKGPQTHAGRTEMNFLTEWGNNFMHSWTLLQRS